MPPRQKEPNTLALRGDRENKGGLEKLTAEIDERNRRMDRFEFWLFLSIWMVITAVAGLAIWLHN